MILVTSLVAAGTAVAGWVANGLRPGARARRRAKGALKAIRREERAREKLIDKVGAEMAAKASAYVEAAIKERLSGLPVEDLRGFGAEKVRWGALAEAGLATVGDLVEKSAAELTRLKGVGPLSTQRILRARKRLLEANREEPVPPPGPGAADDITRAALLAAHEVLQVRDGLGTLPGELERFATPLRRRYATVAEHTALFHGLLDEEHRAEKRAALAEADRIVEEVARETHAEGLVARHRAARETARRSLGQRLTPEALARDHVERFADYCAVLSKALAKRIRGTAGPQGGLPAEIAARVEEFPLRTGLLNLTLRGYQEFGAKYLLTQERTLLGDEMGLGKTVQALAVGAHLSETGEGERFLVVAPASVLTNWVRETAERTALAAHLLHGSGREAAFADWCATGGVGVTSFRTLSTLLEASAEQGHDWPPVDLLIVDEAHYAKNPNSRRTLAVRAVSDAALRVTYLSGTPLENRLDEFRVLVSMLQPDVAEVLETSVEATGDLTLGRHAFQESVSPVYLRRNQEDVLTELPERIDKEEWVELSPEEKATYAAAVAQREIMAMRRAATLGKGTPESAKLDRLGELLDEYREEGRKVIVFSFFLDVLDACERRFETHGRVSGETPVADRQGILDAFAAREGHALLLGQINAAGVGLNVQAASVVVLLEPQWKPSTEDQAIARAHRMGQTRTVIVHRFFASDSVDERMREVLAQKAELFDAFARGSSIKEASREATEASLVRQVIEAEVERLAEPERT